jgi:hypothetical protein
VFITPADSGATRGIPNASPEALALDANIVGRK